ncbi:hypothetical protein C6341_g16811 [Phytophthora cactorum]|nr:hypothetical protein C6341_g16811 [Phytophthora cactorum]
MDESSTANTKCCNPRLQTQKIEPNTGAAINNDNDDSFLAPPILINWNFRELQDFVSRANATHSRAADFPKPARWLNVRAPYMTAASL